MEASMLGKQALDVKREIEVTLIPSGAKVMLQEGTQVFVTQALGNAYTVYVNGNLVRVAGKDGDALGLVILAEADVNACAGTVEEKIWKQLKTCFDPEIPVNIVDLGLVYHVVVQEEPDACRAEIVMTLTAAGCGMGPVLVGEIEEKVRTIAGVTEVKVELTFDPPWDRER